MRDAPCPDWSVSILPIFISMKLRLLAPSLLALLLTVPVIAAGEAPGLVYAAPDYDPARDADADLAEAKKIAARDGRRILLVVGGDWCPWCLAISRYFEENTSVRGILSEAYVIQKVNVSDEKSNTGFLDPYPAIRAYPHLFVLDAEGKLLRSTDTGVFESGRAYDERKMVALFEKWRLKTD